MSLIDRGQAALNERMKAGAGRTVTYTRKSDGAAVTLTAWVGKTLFARGPAEPGAAVIHGERDYLFAVADLAVNGTTFTPAGGDRITEAVNGAALTFELITPTGEPAWRYSDATRQTYRVHVKRLT